MEVELKVNPVEDKDKSNDSSDNITKENVIEDESNVSVRTSAQYEQKLHTGNVYTFFYYKGYPLFTIGPDCTFILTEKGYILWC